MVRELIATKPGGVVKIGKDTLEALLDRMAAAEAFIKPELIETHEQLKLYDAWIKAAGIDQKSGS